MTEKTAPKKIKWQRTSDTTLELKDDKNNTWQFSSKQGKLQGRYYKRPSFKAYLYLSKNHQIILSTGGFTWGEVKKLTGGKFINFLNQCSWDNQQRQKVADVIHEMGIEELWRKEFSQENH